MAKRKKGKKRSKVTSIEKQLKDKQVARKKRQKLHEKSIKLRIKKQMDSIKKLKLKEKQHTKNITLLKKDMKNF